MDKETVLDYPDLPAERLMYWQKRAFREWAFRPGPMLTYLKMLLSDWSTIKSALSVGFQHFSWANSDDSSPAIPEFKRLPDDLRPGKIVMLRLILQVGDNILAQKN